MAVDSSDPEAQPGEPVPPQRDSRPPTGAIRALWTETSTSPDTTVQVVDTPEARVRHPSDAVSVVLYALGSALVVLAAIYAHATTLGVTTDVRSFNTLLRTLLILPFGVLTGLATLLLPPIVLSELGFRRLGRQIIESIVAAMLALFLGIMVFYAIGLWGNPALIDAFSARHGFMFPGYVAALAGLLTVAGPRTRRRSVAWSWNLLFMISTLGIITGDVALPSFLLTICVGRIAGFLVRYTSGVRSERAYGPELLTAIIRAGFHPTSVTQVPPPLDAAPDQVTASAAFAPSSGNRLYAMEAGGQQYDVIVLDGDRQVIGVLARIWRSIRLRGVERRAVMSLRAVAERSALLTYAATAAGVRTPQLLGVGAALDSMVLVTEHLNEPVSLRSVAETELTDELLQECWRQLTLAHASGLTHRALTVDVVLMARSATAPGPRVWLTGWDQGDIASSTLFKRMDVTQMVALLALRVGAARAVHSAAQALPDDDIAAIGPLLQSITLPSTTRADFRRNKQLMAELRAALLERLPEANVEPLPLNRFSPRAMLTAALSIVAVVVVSLTLEVLQPKTIAEAFRDANLWWVLASFGLGQITLVGSAITLVAFSPVRLPAWRTFLVQTAASYVALAVPAGVGPAALNLRLLTKRGTSTPMAVATVALVQASQFVVTVLLLVTLSLFTGQGDFFQRPSTTIMVALAVLAGATIGVLLIPAMRTWLMKRIRPTVEQLWPRLSQMLSQPKRLTAGVLGNLLVTLGFVFAFDAALRAFGIQKDLMDVAVICLLANTVGAAVPVPGGIGATELSLSTALKVAGVGAGTAMSIAIMFRVTTYWLRIPLGWAAMKYLQRRGEI